MEIQNARKIKKDGVCCFGKESDSGFNTPLTTLKLPCVASSWALTPPLCKRGGLITMPGSQSDSKTSSGRRLLISSLRPPPVMDLFNNLMGSRTSLTFLQARAFAHPAKMRFHKEAV